MFPSHQDVMRLAPEIVLCAAGILIMVIEPFAGRAGRRAVDAMAVLGAAAALAAVVLPMRNPGTAFSELLRVDAFSVFIHAIVGAVALLAILAAPSYLDREGLPHGEFYSLVLFAAAGMGVLASAQDLITAFVGLEVSSIASYILASYRRNSPRSNEAALKYFLLGSFATAFFLYGVALIYGSSGTTLLPKIDAGATQPTLLALGLALLFVGLAFKVAAAPFQLWTPDVYEGAPAPVTALLSTGPKAAAFALFLRIYMTVDHASSLWFWAFWISAVVTMFAGNITALVQTNVKRMLAYSSIAHAGYILVAFAAGSALGTAAVLFYLAAYALMKLGAFTALSWLSGPGERHMELDDYAGLASQRPVAAACFSLFLLSLLGLPVTAGFLGKFYIFDAALKSHLVWLTVFLALNTIIGAYYYLRVIVAMYMRPATREFPAGRVPAGVAAVLALAAAGTIFLGLFPNPVIEFAARAATMLK
ncbi:MAG TPA: NADH-quinone oxidoreductase subunit N [Candidatus Acidoferrales bacterium]|jgi:NADH-quinone oxidoreductase subunit N|nr:NADH-quinone oxidoreductase subunit N [Candidatus Acidoferrales bacterium]